MRSRAAALVIMLAIIAVALAARLDRLGAQQLWADEALTVVTSGFDTLRLWFAPIDPTPGFYFSLHHLLFGDAADPATVRSLSVAMAVALVPAIYWLVRAMLPVSVSLLAAALVALNGTMVDYAQEARAYALVLLLLTVAARALIGWDSSSERSLRWSWLFVVSATLAAYTHLVGTIVLAGELALIVVLAASRRPIAWRGLIVMLLPSLLVLPEIARLNAFATGSQGFDWLPAADVAETLYNQAYLLSPAGMLGPDGLPNPAVPLDPFGYAGILLVWIGSTLLLRRAALRRFIAEHRAAAAVMALFLLFPLTLFAIGQLARPVLTLRTSLPFLIGAIPLIALTASLDVKPWRGLVIATLLILVPSAFGLARGAGRHQKEDWARVVAILKAEARPGDIVIGCSLITFPTLNAAAEPRGGVSLPMLINYGGREVLAARTIGATGWAAKFREPLWSGYIAGQENAVIGRAPTIALPMRRLWIAYSACEPADRARIERLVGGATAKRRWWIDRTLFHAVTGLDRFDLSQPVFIRVPEPAA